MGTPSSLGAAGNIQAVLQVSKGLMSQSELAPAVAKATSVDKWERVLERAFEDAAQGDNSAREFLLAVELMGW